MLNFICKDKPLSILFEFEEFKTQFMRERNHNHNLNFNSNTERESIANTVNYRLNDANLKIPNYFTSLKRLEDFIKNLIFFYSWYL